MTGKGKFITISPVWKVRMTEQLQSSSTSSAGKEMSIRQQHKALQRLFSTGPMFNPDGVMSGLTTKGARTVGYEEAKREARKLYHGDDVEMEELEETFKEKLETERQAIYHTTRYERALHRGRAAAWQDAIDHL